MKNQLILWDVDGTLMYCGSDGTKALNKTFHDLYGIEDAFSQSGIGSAMDSVILEGIMERFRLNRNDLENIKTVYIDQLSVILREDQNKRVLPGVRELLEYIGASCNCFNALLTSNLRNGAITKLESVGLEQYFHAGGFGDDIGEKWDAAQKGIAEAEEYFQVDFAKENIYLVGDSAYDIECAKKMGIVSIGVATGWMDYSVLKSHKPDYLYQDLSDWKKIVFITDCNKKQQNEKRKQK